MGQLSSCPCFELQLWFYPYFLSLCIFTVTVWKRNLILPLLHEQHITVLKKTILPLQIYPYFFRILWIYPCLPLYFSSISIRISIRIWHNLDSIMAYKIKLEPVLDLAECGACVFGASKIDWQNVLSHSCSWLVNCRGSSSGDISFLLYCPATVAW